MTAGGEEGEERMIVNQKNGRKIVLVYASLPERLPTLSFPIGPLYVGSYLDNMGYDVSILDANNYRSDWDFFDTLAREAEASLAVGLSVMTAQVPSALKISRFVKSLSPSIPVVWGGVHPSLFPEQTVQSQYVDYVVRDEGEDSMLELLKALQGEMAFDTVNGIAFLSDVDQAVVTTSREVMDLDDMPPVKWSLLESIKPGRRLTIADIGELTGRGVYLQTGRGCPHRCTFCINSVLKNGYRDKRSDLVLRDIKELTDLGVDRIWFTDENFFTSKRRVGEILDGIERDDLRFKWFATIRANYIGPKYVDDALLARLKRDGCEMLAIGAESGSQKILDMLKKDITVQDTLAAAHRLAQAGFKASFSFMTGLPSEEKEDILKTLGLIEDITRVDTSLSFRILGPQVYRPYPGSDLYSECLSFGMKEPTTLEEWAGSLYIRSETVLSPEAYPWIRHSSKFINNVVFYGNLLGNRLRFKILTRFLRRIAALRCRHLFFSLPIERLVYRLVMKTGAYKLLRIRRILGE